jgi:hypothetical protein
VAIGFGVVLGASAAVGVALGWTEPYWVPEPVLILVLDIVTGKRDRIRGKAIGTALGVAAAIPSPSSPHPQESSPRSARSPSSSRSPWPRPTG